MPESVSINEKLRIIEVKSFGDVSSADMTRSVTEVKRLHEETGLRSVLVDTRDLTALPNVTDMFELVQSFPRGMRIAVLIVPNSEALAELQFGETVAQNRGIDVRLFESDVEALDWLKE